MSLLFQWASRALLWSLLMEDQVLLERAFVKSKQHSFKSWGFFPLNNEATLSGAYYDIYAIESFFTFLMVLSWVKTVDPCALAKTLLLLLLSRALL